MTVLVVIEIPGGSSGLDEVLTDTWHLADRPPSGNRLRLAGPMDGGWRVVSLWDSREEFQSFLRDRLHFTLEEAGERQPTVTYWDVETVHRFD